MDAAAAANDTPVQMIDTSIVRVDQHGVCITRNRVQSMGQLGVTYAAIPIPIAPKAKHSARSLLNSGDDEDEAPPTMPRCPDHDIAACLTLHPTPFAARRLAYDMVRS